LIKWRYNIMGSRNHNVSQEGILELYSDMIEKFDMEKRDSTPLKKRLKQLKLKYMEKDKLTVAVGFLKDVISDVEGFQDKYGMSTDLYYTIKEFIDG
tara:strand:+ start:206 stop:496 length:291 start_codon:yes stop_codon:yes gene_type:complete